MSLVIYSSQPIPKMRALAARLFSEVPDKGLGRVSYRRARPAFTSSQLGILRRIKTVAKAKKLTLKFVLPPYHDQFDSNPVKVLQFPLGHEGKGSLLSLLLRRGLALGLTVSHQDVADYFTCLEVEIELTSKGLRQNRKVLELFFSYVRVLIQRGLTRALFDEIRRMNDIKFKFRSKTSELQKTVEVADLLSDYPPELVNRVQFVYDRFDPEGFQSLLGRIVPDNLVAVLQNDQFEGLSGRDPIYGTAFQDKPFAPSLVERIRLILTGGLGQRVSNNQDGSLWPTRRVCRCRSQTSSFQTISPSSTCRTAGSSSPNSCRHRTTRSCSRCPTTSSGCRRPN